MKGSAEMLEIMSNDLVAENVYKMVLCGDLSNVTKPGQFVNIKIDGLYLRRPISVCDKEGDFLTIIYKVVGKGTEEMRRMGKGKKLDVLTGLGNGYSVQESGNAPLLLGGGVGVPPLLWLAKKLVSEGKKVTAAIGFNSKNEVFLENELRDAGSDVFVATADGSYGSKGFVTDIMPQEYSYFYACGPEPMLKAVYDKTCTSGQLSFEERMGCGFGACMGCSCKTKYGFKRICKEGPVLLKEEIIW